MNLNQKIMNINQDIMNANYANKPMQWPITAKSNIPKELQVQYKSTQ